MIAPLVFFGYLMYRICLICNVFSVVLWHDLYSYWDMESEELGAQITTLVLLSNRCVR